MSSDARPSFNLLPWFLGALAALLAFLCAWLTRLYFDARAENVLLRQERALAALELRAAHNQLEAERILAAHAPAQPAGKVTAPPPAAGAPPPR